MLTSETQRKIHQLQNDSLVIEEEKRHLRRDLEKLHQDEKVYRHTFDIAQKNLENNRVEAHRKENRLAELEEESRRIKTLIKNQHD
jgi:DNA repair exonuclease SbcCD ATPase subunit